VLEFLLSGNIDSRSANRFDSGVMGLVAICLLF
jgi:hypothetical protein